jgi:hypothetical protein
VIFAVEPLHSVIVLVGAKCEVKVIYATALWHHRAYLIVFLEGTIYTTSRITASRSSSVVGAPVRVGCSPSLCPDPTQRDVGNAEAIEDCCAGLEFVDYSLERLVLISGA